MMMYLRNFVTSEKEMCVLDFHNWWRKSYRDFNSSTLWYKICVLAFNPNISIAQLNQTGGTVNLGAFLNLKVFIIFTFI